MHGVYAFGQKLTFWQSQSHFLLWSQYYYLLEVCISAFDSVRTLAPGCRVDGSRQRVIDWCHGHNARTILIWQLDKPSSNMSRTTLDRQYSQNAIELEICDLTQERYAVYSKIWISRVPATAACHPDKCFIIITYSICIQLFWNNSNLAFNILKGK